MSRFIYYSAMTINILALVGIFFVMATEANRQQEFLILFLAALPPVSALIAIYSLPDLEERKLARALNKAQLRKELEKLEK